jgi:hypothetical protein
LTNEDPDNIPADLLIQSVTYGGDYSQNQIGEKWVHFDYIMTNYMKTFCSKVYRQKEKAHFFIVFKKRILIKKGRDMIFEEKQVENLMNPFEGKF